MAVQIKYFIETNKYLSLKLVLERWRISVVCIVKKDKHKEQNLSKYNPSGIQLRYI